MSFRQVRTVLKEGIGSYVNGLWVAGTRTVGTISASVQPTKLSELKQYPEGRLEDVFVKIYTGTELQASEDAGNSTQGYQPDMIEWRGWCYEIVTKAEYQSGVVSHFKYIAKRRSRYTTNADWVNGITER